MSVKVGDIKSFTLITGMEVIAKVASIDDGVYNLSEAFAVTVEATTDAHGNQTGARIGMAPLSPFAMAESKSGGMNIDLFHPTILLATNPPTQLVDQYTTQTSTILTPPKQKIVTGV